MSSLPATHAADAPRRPLIAVKDVGWLIYLYPVRFLASLLPARAVHWVARLVERGLRPVGRRFEGQLLAALEAGLGRSTSAEQRAAIARAFCDNAAVRAIDDLLMDKLVDGGRLPVEVIGLEHLQAALSRGKGAMILTFHFFAHRLALRHLAHIGYPVLCVRNESPRDPDMGRLGAAFCKKLYQRFLHEIIRDEVYFHDPECTLKLLARLRSGGLVNLHLDATLARQLVTVPFLGAARSFPTGALEIVRHTGCGVLTMLSIRDQSGLRIVFEPPLAMKAASSRDEYRSLNLPQIAGRLEAQILEHPDQWALWVRLG